MMDVSVTLLHIFVFALAADGLELEFPEDFKFGVATAAYQVEGGWNASGKGENIWDRLTHEHPEWIKDHSNGDVACDSYNKYEEDIAAIKYVGANFYRFSISWARLLPSGFSNHINPDGVRYYNALINKLLEAGIEPMVTIYHWDLPQPLQDMGGWPNEIMASYFRDYANVVFKLFGDRVKTWVTFNEPNEVCESAYGIGGDAPAYKYPGVADYLCGRTLLLAHAKVYRLYNNRYRKQQNGKVGITVSSIWSEPKTNSNENKDAAERYLQMNFGWWVHPILSPTGDYPDIMKKRIELISKLEGYSNSRLPKFNKKQINLLKSSCDFLGVNHYSTWLSSNHEYPSNSSTSQLKDVGVKREQDPSWKHSSLYWLRVVPWGFRKLLNWIKNEYGNPLVYVTENGFADTGGLNDRGRIEYHQGYLKALLEAIAIDKCNVKRYTIWSIIDNMEWREGYTAKFGLFEVDFSSDNRTRTPKLSAKYFKNVISSRKP